MRANVRLRAVMCGHVRLPAILFTRGKIAVSKEVSASDWQSRGKNGGLKQPRAGSSFGSNERQENIQSAGRLHAG